MTSSGETINYNAGNITVLVSLTFVSLNAMLTLAGYCHGERVAETTTAAVQVAPPHPPMTGRKIDWGNIFLDWEIEKYESNQCKMIQVHRCSRLAELIRSALTFMDAASSDLLLATLAS